MKDYARPERYKYSSNTEGKKPNHGHGATPNSIVQCAYEDHRDGASK